MFESNPAGSGDFWEDNMKRILMILCLIAGGPLAMLAQNSRFTGHVTDTSGAAVVGAQIQVLNQDSGETASTVTTTSGDYSVPYLKPGVYTLSAEKQGFRMAKESSVAIHVNEVSTVNFSLQVGVVSDTIEVVAEAARIEFAKADRGEVMEADRIEKMPLNSRNPLMLFSLSPGIYNGTSDTYQRPFDNVNKSIYIGGGTQLIYTLDGVAGEMMNNNISYVPPVDSLQEFKIVLNPLDASYGRGSGGAMDMQFKSGTSKYHGNVYEFARRTYMNANAWQNNFYKKTRSTNSADQYGFQMDGPVRIPHFTKGKEKTFFLVQFENYREVTPNSPFTYTTPDKNWLKQDSGGYYADFSGVTYYNSTTKSQQPLLVYDPMTALSSVVDPNDGRTKQAHAQFANNIIPSSRVNQAMAKIFAYYPASNTTAGGAGLGNWQNNGYWMYTENITYRSATAKIDHTLSDNDKLSLRWSWQRRYTDGQTSAMPRSNPANTDEPGYMPMDHAFSLDEVHVFTPKLVLDNRLSVSRYLSGAGLVPNHPVSDYGWSSTFAAQVPWFRRMPLVKADGFQQLGKTLYYKEIENTVAYQPSLTWIRGGHTMRTGMDLRIQQFGKPSDWGDVEFDFSSGWTSRFYNNSDASGYSSGFSMASMLLGYANSSSYVSAPYLFMMSQRYWAGWAQDDWKVTPKLTLNLGFRWDLTFPMTERHNKINYRFNQNVVNPINSDANYSSSAAGGRSAMGGVEFAGVNGNPRSAWKLNKNELQPRLGAAYAINGKTSLRGGIGLMYLTVEERGSNYGFNASSSYVDSVNGLGVTPMDTMTSNPYPTGTVSAVGSSLGYKASLGNSYDFIDPNFKVPNTWSYNLTLQRELTSSDVLEVSYQGSRTLGMKASRNLNAQSSSLQAACDLLRGGTRYYCDNTSTGKAANPFYHVSGFEGTSYYTSTMLSILDLSRQFPQFKNVWQRSNSVRSWYNSLQVVETHRVSHNLTAHATWTYSKNMFAGSILDATNNVYGRQVDSTDHAHSFTFSGSYTLPVGRGQMLLGHSNRIVDTLVGGWEVAPLYVYQSGLPWSPGNNWLYPGKAKGSGKTLAPDSNNSYSRIQGVSPCVGYYNNDTGAIVQGATYTSSCSGFDMIRIPTSGYSMSVNKVYTGVRNPAKHQFDANFSKWIDLTHGYRLQVRADAFNVLNHPIWSGYSSDPTSTSWGTITKGNNSPSNSPRRLQISAKLNW